MRKGYDFRNGKRGAVVPAPPGQTRITIRIDDDLLERLRARVNAAGGGDYQALINEAVREYVARRPRRGAGSTRRTAREEGLRRKALSPKRGRRSDGESQPVGDLHSARSVHLRGR